MFSFFFNDTAITEIYTLSLHDVFFFNDTATTEIYTLSLHDALPIVTRGIRRQHLVHDVQAAIGVGTELELGIGQDDAALARVVGGELVDAQGGVAHALGQVGTDLLHHRIEIDVLVMVADGGLGRGGEDRLRQLLGLAQAVGQVDTADLAGALVVLPAAADQVAAGDRFHRHQIGRAHV